jgi:hypothetical protein
VLGGDPGPGGVSFSYFEERARRLAVPPPLRLGP